MSSKKRVDIFLLEKHPELTRSSIHQLIKHGYLDINGSLIKKSGTIINPDEDKIDLKIPKIKIKNNIKIIYEDNDVIIINKPAGILSHPKGPVLLEETVADFIKPKINFQKIDNRAGIVHRLDRNTSGIMICAKNEQSRLWLLKQFATRKVQKTYLSICIGHFSKKEALIDLPILRNPNKPQTFKVDPRGKIAQTYYKVIKETKNYSLVCLQPKTGRTHQLRVHMSYLGHPILGDSIYSKKENLRMFLHAEQLTIRINKDSDFKTFKSQKPKIFNEVLKNDQ